MRDLRVLHVVSAIAPQYGGTSMAVLGLCEALSAIPGVTVELAATDADGSNGHLPISTFAALPFRTHLFPVTGSQRWKYSAGLNDWLRDNVRRFDVIHLHGAWAHATKAGRTAARAKSRPYVLSPHGMLSEYSFARFPLLKWTYWLSVERKTCRRAAAILATSTGESKELRRLDLPTPIRVIPLGIDPQAWTTPADPNALRRLCIPAAADLPILLFLSRLHPKKGITDYLLPAFARLEQPAFLAIAGGIDHSTPEYRGEIEATIARFGLSGRVALLGPVAPCDRWQLFDGAAAFVLPSHQENFGLVVAEAMARGCPVVISDRVHSCNHVQAAGAGKVVSLDVVAVAEACDELLSDPQARVGQARRAAEYAAKHFRWECVVESMVELYRRVAGIKTPPRREIRCLHVIPSISSAEGGPSLAIGPLCTSLNRIPGIHVEIATTVAESGVPNRETVSVNKTTIHRFARSNPRGVKHSRELTRWLRSRASEFDLIHIHTLWSLVSSSACRLAGSARVPYIIRPAGMLSPYSWAHGWLKKWLYWHCRDRRLVARAAALHATSAGEAAELRGMRLRPPVNMIPLGVDPQAWSTPADRGKLRQLCGPTAGDLPIFLFLSRLHPKKGVVDYLLPAFARLKRPAFLAIAGGADGSVPDYPCEIEAAIRDLGLSERVALLGPVAPADRWQLFDGATAFVLPSHQENFGIVVAEAMARGCPVVISDRVQSCDHVLASGAGRVIPLEIDSFASAMAELLEDEPTRTKMSRSGPPYARAELDWDSIATKIAEMYRACLRIDRDSLTLPPDSSWQAIKRTSD